MKLILIKLMTLDDLEKKRGEQLDQEIADLGLEIERLTGVKIGNVRLIIPLGTKSLLHNCESVINLNKYSYNVDSDLIFDGWIPFHTIPLTRDYFQKRAKCLENMEGQEVKEVRSQHLNTGEKIMVFYGKDLDTNKNIY